MPEPTLYPPPGPLTVGQVLDLSFRIYRRTFVKCLLFGALTVVLRWLPNGYAMARGQPAVQSLVRPGTAIIFMVAGAVLALVFHVAITLRQYRIIGGQGVGGELLQALRWLGRIIIIIVLLLLVGIACAVVLIPAFLASGFGRYLLLGLLLLPMVYVFLRLACVFTVMVVEDIGATDSMARSWELTGGNVLRLTAINTVALFLLAALYFVVGAVTGFLYAVFGRGDVALITAAIGVMTVAAGAVVTPYYSALALAIFGDLRVRKEGADLSQRISAA